ncbi:hypothetical protein V8E54_004827 [Elaphomyces granulatus]
MPQAFPALTTTFVPPSSCLTDTYLYDINPTQTSPYFYSLGPPGTSDCFPSGWESVTTAYFSPGVCPLGYSMACSNYNSIGTLTETTATCCPSGYTCFTLSPVPGSLTGPPWFTGEACSSKFESKEHITVTTTNAQGSGTTETTVSEIDGINAFGIIIRYQSSDLITSTALLTRSTQLPTSLPASSIPSASSSSSSQFTTTSTALSATNGNTGRNIGIGVGVSLGSIGILSGIFAIWFVRRRPRASDRSRNIGDPSQEVASMYSNS